MLRNHSFRKANIAVGVSIMVAVTGALVVGRHPSDTESLVLAGSIFGSMLIALFAQYEWEYRMRRRRSERGSSSPKPSV